MLRKKAGKTERGRQRKEVSAPKRRKIGEKNEYKELNIVEFEKITHD